jgi:hypothetical protein
VVWCGVVGAEWKKTQCAHVGFQRYNFCVLSLKNGTRKGIIFIGYSSNIVLYGSNLKPM